MDFTEKTLSAETIFHGKVIDVSLDQVMLPNGKKGQRERVNHPGAVGVIAITAENKIVMVRQFRKALEQTLVEIPAGKLEKRESPENCARRELEEETGFQCGSLKHVTSFYTSPGYCNEIVHLYYTDQLMAGEQKPDEDEFVEIMQVTFSDALQLVEKREIYDAKTMYAMQYLQLKNAGERI